MTPLAALTGDRQGTTPDPALIPAIAADGSLYPIEKMQAHRLGTHHLAVSVFVFSGDDLLIQQRAAGKYHCAGAWANTCCSHPHWGEAPARAAERRLAEELGLQGLALDHTAVIDYAADVSDGLRECERVHVFRASADRDSLRFRPDPGEVSQTRWADWRDLRSEARATPAVFAPWFRIYLERWSELGF
jgi:isopentenyl-diphosphate Delta-isomerase